MKRLPILALAALLLTAASPGSRPSAEAASYLDRFVDASVNPGNDLFQYSVGKWLKENPIPESERSWGIAKVIQEETYRRLVDLSEGAAANAQAPRGSNAQKIGDFWYAAMDTVSIAKEGITPLKDEFARIAAVQDRDGVIDAIARLQYIGVGAMCGIYLYQDEKNSERYAAHLYQGGLGLPDRDYYFDTDDRAQMLRKAYVEHVTKMFELLGDPAETARKNAAIVMVLETDLAGASRKLEALRDPIANYNKMSVAGLSTLAPSVQWKHFLEAGKIRVDSVIVGQPEFFQQVEKSLGSRSVEEWKTYLRWQLLTTFAAPAGGEFDAQNFAFYGTILNGTKVQRPRWKRMLDQEESYLGDALGQLYVEKYFSPRTKQRYEKLTEEIFQAFRERIAKLDWMSAATKKRALKKLNSVTRKVGYPAKWKDYSSFEVDRRSYLGNVLRGNVWNSDYIIAKLYKPVDRTEWGMTPQTYNAYYNPSNNEIVMPAAIFILPGIADSLVDDAIVYSYAGGTTIGHEITHGFDDQGRQFDEKGNLESWWTKADEDEFKRRSRRIVEQFNGYVAVGDIHVNGDATQGENIADLGGMLLGWDAFKKTEQYKRGEKLGGLTPAQRYFVGWALGWMNQLRPENLMLRVKTDVHAPSFLRVNGPAANLPEFYEAFGVKPGAKMWREDSVRVKIW